MANEFTPARKQHMDELASLYLLGLLDRDDMRAFEEMLRSHDTGATLAFRSFAGAAAEYASAQVRTRPPAALKHRLMQRIQGTDQEGRPKPRPRLGAIRSGEGVWRDSGFPGVSYKVVFYDRAAELVTTLVKMEPGASYPAHRHNKPEQCLVVEGDLWHDDHEYGPGDFTWAEADSIDPQISTKNGNILLIIGAREAEFVES